MIIRTTLGAAVGQWRMRGASPLALLSGVALPCVFAYVIQAYRGGATDADFAVGVAGLGVLDALVVLIAISLIDEKRHKTLQPALSSPVGMAPVIFGRLLGMGLQSMLAIPGTLIFLVLMWGLAPGFDWWRWFIGTIAITIAMISMMGLLGFVILRFPFSPGMTNGLVGLVVALGALLSPTEALPAVLKPLSLILPQSHVMAWVRGGAQTHLLLAAVLAATAVSIMVVLVRLLEEQVRRHALSLEV